MKRKYWQVIIKKQFHVLNNEYLTNFLFERLNRKGGQGYNV